MVKPAADITDSRLLDFGSAYGPFAGAVLGFATFLATGLVYLAIRLIRRKPSTLVALILTAAGYSAWLVSGYDLVYREPRYAEVARAIITYLGKPMLYSAAIVCVASAIGAVIALVLKKRAS